MYIIFPRYANANKQKLKVSDITQHGYCIQDQNLRQPIFMATVDTDLIKRVAEYIAKEYAGTEILIAKVETIVESPPGKIKTRIINEKNELLPG